MDGGRVGAQGAKRPRQFFNGLLGRARAPAGDGSASTGHERSGCQLALAVSGSLPLKPIHVTEHRVPSFDGTEIAYHEAGDGAPVLLCNGLGGSWMAWSHQIRYFQDNRRFLSWDYRGLYRSGPPPSLDALQVADQVGDALAVLDHAKADRAWVFGWSMGVQVALEL